MPQHASVYPIILVADDLADARLTLRCMLERHDCRVVEAHNGREAVGASQRDCPDLILLDLNMPQMDGREAAQRIRACKEACRGVPIIATSSSWTESCGTTYRGVELSRLTP